MNEQIKVSVIVPAFMVSPYIDQCMESLCRQTEKNIEIICVYTESKDGTFDKLQKWIAQDSRIKLVVRNDGGLGGARNTGMGYASGKYIAFVDSDDWIEETMLQKLLETAEMRDADVVMCAIRSFDETKKEFLENSWGSDLPFPDTLLEKSFTWREISPEVFVSPDAPVTAWNKLYRTSYIKKEKLRFPENCRYEDNPFYYEIMASARVSFVREAYYNYRVNRAGSLQASSCMDESVFDIIKVMKSISDMLIRRGIGEKYYEAFYSYMLDEFSWRFQTLRGNKRKFLKAVHNAFAENVYADFLKALSVWGENLDSPIYQKAIAEIPQVSVVIPTYNNAHEIAQCLDSVLGQIGITLEVYCVDDCSTDSTKDILQHYCEKDARVHFIHKEKNSGAGVSREFAMRKVNGEFVFFLDGDDLLPNPDVLHKMYVACKKNKKLTSAGNMQCFFNNDPTQISTYSGNVFSESGSRSYEDYTPHPSWGFTRFLFNLEVILENDIHFPEWRYYEDPLFFVRYMTAEKEYFAITDTVYLYRQKQDKKEVFTESKFLNLFASLKIIFPLLETVNKKVYYAEYHTFLQFCLHLYDYLKDNSYATKDLVYGANEIFQMIDFSAYQATFPMQEIFRSYEQFEIAQHTGEAIPVTVTDEKGEVFENVEKEQDSMLRRPSFLRRILKKLLKPFYAPFRNRYETPLWEARGYASGTWEHTALLLQQMSTVQQQLYTLQQGIQAVNTLLEKHQAEMFELQKKQEEHQSEILEVQKKQEEHFVSLITLYQNEKQETTKKNRALEEKIEEQKNYFEKYFAMQKNCWMKT